MFWISLVVLIIAIWLFIATYIIDFTTINCINKIEQTDIFPIKEISRQYLEGYDMKIDKPIVYRFVNFNPKKNGDILLGIFHEWNGKYYIDISVSLLMDRGNLEETVRHETRHMMVKYLKDKKIIDLTKYTEEIANEKNIYYRDMLDGGVYLLESFGKNP